MRTLGEQLRQAREARGETLKDVEGATRIRALYLEALEAGDPALFPGGAVQIRGFLRVYARHLGLSAEEAVAQFKKLPRALKVTISPAMATHSSPRSLSWYAAPPSGFGQVVTGSMGSNREVVVLYSYQVSFLK